MPHSARDRATQDFNKGTASAEQRVLFFADLLLYYYDNSGDLEFVFMHPPAELEEMAYAAACFQEFEICQVIIEYLEARGVGEADEEELMDLAEDYYDDLSWRIPGETTFEKRADRWAVEHSLPTKWS